MNSIRLGLWSESRALSDVLFWKELEKHQRPIISGPIYVKGQRVADDLPTIQKELFSMSNAMSHLFFEYVQIKGLKPKTVLDLSCGIGPNSIPLLKHRVYVKAIDNMMLEAYSQNVKNRMDRQFVTLKCADLTTLEKYTEEANAADVVIATDVLPYLPILCWKSTMEKIVFSLKPGGYLFGTVYVKAPLNNDYTIEVDESFGAQYFVIDNLAERLVKHSGLEMLECRLRKDSFGVWEFVARKPVAEDEKVFFEDLREGAPFVIKSNRE